eukprot:TRINITY_DN488_c0_g1_i2.p1 TRINITY_DN488_c0_g1~~TRINITY_DN488_c0_g1_i2.p1  ORF type:complete len:342 (-),score=92.10 TRINITY_DN488_c0_g1_i2:331-1356(-)
MMRELAVVLWENGVSVAEVLGVKDKEVTVRCLNLAHSTEDEDIFKSDESCPVAAVDHTSILGRVTAKVGAQGGEGSAPGQACYFFLAKELKEKVRRMAMAVLPQGAGLGQHLAAGQVVSEAHVLPAPAVVPGVPATVTPEQRRQQQDEGVGEAQFVQPLVAPQYPVVEASNPRARLLVGLPSSMFPSMNFKEDRRDSLQLALCRARVKGPSGWKVCATHVHKKTKRKSGSTVFSRATKRTRSDSSPSSTTPTSPQVQRSPRQKPPLQTQQPHQPQTQSPSPPQQQEPTTTTAEGASPDPVEEQQQEAQQPTEQVDETSETEAERRNRKSSPAANEKSTPCE